MPQDIRILAVGNDLRGDDGVGLYAGKLLETRGFKVFFAHETPENMLGRLRGAGRIIIIDAAHFDGDGPYRIIREVPADSFYTHKLDLKKIEKFTGARVWLVGIKTYNRRLGGKISRQAKANAREAIKVVEVCMAFPAKIIDEKEKIIEINGEQKKVKFGMPGLKKGDFVLVHAGVVVEKMSEKDFEKLSEDMKEFTI